MNAQTGTGEIIAEKTDQPLVSVIMPVWNGEIYLAEAIRSILSQTYRRLELIIVDDGSEDETGRIAAYYARVDTRVHLLCLTHQGVIQARNAGCSSASGKYIAFLDCDDIALSQRLEQQVGFLESHPEIALVGSATECIVSSGKGTNMVFHPPSDNMTIQRILRVHNCLCQSSVMVRAHTFSDVGGYRHAFKHAEDYDLWMRFADNYELANLTNVLVLYRLHSRQDSLRHLEQQALTALAVRVSSEQRRRTGLDPLKSADVVDRSTLRGLGIRDDDIDRVLVRAYLTWFSSLTQVGLGKAVLTVMRETLAHHLSMLDSIGSTLL